LCATLARATCKRTYCEGHVLRSMVVNAGFLEVLDYLDTVNRGCIYRGEKMTHSLFDPSVPLNASDCSAVGSRG
jgi:hypothetical protein